MRVHMSPEEYEDWVAKAKEAGASHLIIVCNTDENDDYPIYVMPVEDFDEVKAMYDGRHRQEIHTVIAL